MFGKAIGNGHAITAVIGKESIMKSAQNSFISSTFWTEKTGSIAALKTLEIMSELKSWQIISKAGRKIKKGWKKIAETHDVPIEVYGLDALCSYSIIHNNSQAYKTFITQEMLIRGYLASTMIYVSIAHTDKIINNYLENLDEIFKFIGKNIKSGENINKFIKGPVAHSGFKRLN